MKIELEVTLNTFEDEGCISEDQLKRLIQRAMDDIVDQQCEIDRIDVL